jgi:hypothetical protein
MRALQKVTEKEKCNQDKAQNFSSLLLGPLMLVDFINLLVATVIAIIVRRQYENQFNTEVLLEDSFMLRIYNRNSIDQCILMLPRIIWMVNH